jgi:hypothetical protein
MVDESMKPPDATVPPPDPAATATAPPSEQGPGTGFVPRTVIVLIAVVAGLLAAVALYSLWTFWPAGGAGGKAPASQRVNYFGWHTTISRDTLFFLIVALGGAIGGLTHTIRSVSWYVGNRQLRWSWLLFNLMLPVVGALAGTVFYVVLRAGLFSSTAAGAVSPFGFTTVAVLAGLFSEQAMEKLRQIATQLFSEQPVGQDHVAPENPADAGTTTGKT